MATPLEEWVEEVSRLTKPDNIHWCDGSDEEIEKLRGEMIDTGILEPLNQEQYPGCYLHRSDPSDVARTEGSTFICSEKEEDSGPTNNWMAPSQAKERLSGLYDGAMKGRTMYVVPYLMGPASSPHSGLGVEVTDSPYVVANLRIMTRMGKVASERIGSSDKFVPGLHSVGDLNPENRYIMHFTNERLVWSINSGYGGNALLSKKCYALRIASCQARDEGWLAEHMLILEVEEPGGEKTYVAAAFPSACGKTNFAMMVSPLEELGYKVRTIGDDIAWMHISEDGRLWGINPEAGFFGVTPGTSRETNPNAIDTIQRNSIFTNVAVTPDGIPWWEGKDGDQPDSLTDWLGNQWTGENPAAHPNARFTAPASGCPSMSPEWEGAKGVPISAFIFGGRRATLAPLVYQSFSWNHGVYTGATMASEKTAAATGGIGQLRRDPMAMLPFCGYHMGDYFGHWLKMGTLLKNPPKIFHVNWFRKGPGGEWLWPGFGENIRVLQWILQRVRGEGEASETPIGFVPEQGALNIDGLDIDDSTLRELLNVDREEWKEEVEEHREHLDSIGERLPAELNDEYDALSGRL